MRLFSIITGIFGGKREDGQAERPVRRRGARSIIEILVACTVGSLVMAMLVTVTGQTLSSGRITRCMSNLRQIHQGLLLYYEDNQAFPVLQQGQTLQDVLASRLGRSASLFRCPEDHAAEADSYSYFYVPRTMEAGTDTYVLGCPRHRKSDRGVVIFAESHAEYQNLAKVSHDGAAARVGDGFDCGTFTFADGSQATISAGASVNSAAGLSAKVSVASESSSASTRENDSPRISTLFSYRRDDGTCYTVVRMEEGRHGTATFTVVPGNRFEVVTPSAVIAVRGTQFSVTTLKNNGRNATRAEVFSGTVDMEPVSHGRPIRLTGQAGKNKGYVEQGSDPVYE